MIPRHTRREESFERRGGMSCFYEEKGGVYVGSNEEWSSFVQCEPRNVMLVHGEAAKMEFLKQKIHQEFGGYAS